jgi:histidyl-tRNA synthetase
MQEVIEAAPQLLDFLGEASRAHLDTVTAVLRANGVAYSINPRLVRGMDYYNLTVFEFVTTKLGSQGTICAGGRYDYLMEQIGGKPAAAVGWAMGVERVLELLKEQGLHTAGPSLDAYAIVPDVQILPKAMACIQQLRSAGVCVLMHASGPEGMASMKSQFKKADASGARFALVFGHEEIANGLVTVKALRDGNIAQVTQPLDLPVLWAKSLQSTA